MFMLLFLRVYNFLPVFFARVLLSYSHLPIFAVLLHFAGFCAFSLRYVCWRVFVCLRNNYDYYQQDPSFSVRG